MLTNRILLAHPGTQYSYKLAEQLVRYNYLYEFWTGFALAKKAWYATMIMFGLQTVWHKKGANRIIAGVPAKHLRTMPWIEWQALRAINRGEPAEQVLHKRNQIFQERIPTTSIQNSGVVIGFDTSSWLLARRVRNLG